MTDAVHRRLWFRPVSVLPHKCPSPVAAGGPAEAWRSTRATSRTRGTQSDAGSDRQG